MDDKVYEDAIARWTGYRVVLMEPQLAFGGVWRAPTGGHAIVLEGADGSRTNSEGKPLRDWFDGEVRPVTARIELVSTPPGKDWALLDDLSLEEIAYARGTPWTMGDLYRELHLRLPKTFPDFDLQWHDHLVVEVRRDLTSSEAELLKTAVTCLGYGTHEVNLKPPSIQPSTRASTAKSHAGQERPTVTPSRFLRDASPSTRALAERDEDLWRTRIDELLTSEESPHPSDVLHRGDGAVCLVNASGLAPGSLRANLCLYDRIELVLPKIQQWSTHLAAMGVTEQELVTLIEKGRVRALAPDSVEKYPTQFIDSIAERAPHQLVLSRQLACAVLADLRLRWPILFPPIGGAERRWTLGMLFEAAPKVGDAHLRAFFEGLARVLSYAWVDGVGLVRERGARGTGVHSVAEIAAEMVRRISGRNVWIEMISAGESVQWASALGATVFPRETTSYSEEGASELLAALYSTKTDREVDVASVKVHGLLEDILVVHDDVPAVRIAEEFASGDVARLREFIARMAKNPGAEDGHALVERFNAEVRRYEQRADRLRSLNLNGFASATTVAALGLVHVVAPAILPLGVWALGAMLVLGGEELVPKVPALSRWWDRVNGGLSRTSSDAVLVARAKKQLKILKG